jgi:hypothetical protein
LKGHGFSRAVKAAKTLGFSPLYVLSSPQAIYATGSSTLGLVLNSASEAWLFSTGDIRTIRSSNRGYAHLRGVNPGSELGEKLGNDASTDQYNQVKSLPLGFVSARRILFARWLLM